MRQTTVKLLIAMAVLGLAIGLGNSPERASGWSGLPLGGTHRFVTDRTIELLEADGWRYQTETINPDEWWLVMDASVAPDAIHGSSVDDWEDAVKQLSLILLGRPLYVDPPFLPLLCVDPLCDAMMRDFEGLKESHEWTRAWHWSDLARRAFRAAASPKPLDQKLRQDLMTRALIYAGYAIHFAQDHMSPSHLKGWWDEGPDLTRPHTLWEIRDRIYAGCVWDQASRELADAPAGCFGSREDPQQSLRDRIDERYGLMAAAWGSGSVPPAVCALLGEDTDRIALSVEMAAAVTRDILEFVFEVEPPEGCPPEPPECEGTPNVDVALIIDSSNSMSWNDPAELRKAGARVFVEQARNDDQVAVIDFSSSGAGYGNEDARLLSALGPRTADPSPILDAIDNVGPFNWTNMRAGIEQAYEQLNASTSGNRKAAVLLSDGAHNVGDYGDVHLSFKNEGWPIYTLGLYQPGNTERAQGEPLLQRIAAETGGQYLLLEDPNQLVGVYNQVIREVLCGATQLDTAVPLLPGQTSNLAVNIPAGQQQANFLTDWTGSTVDTTLVAPNGTVIGPDTCQPADCYHAKGLSYELYRITNPQPGDWTIRLFGADLPAGGEDVRVQVFTVPTPDTAAPTTDISITGTTGAGGWYVSPVAVALSAADNLGGQGVDWTAYSLDNGGTWQWFFDDADASPFVNQFQVSGEFAGEVWAISADWAEPSNIEDPPAKLPLKVHVAPATPTPTPTPTPTATATPTPSPTALPTVSIPMVAGWNDRCYLGEQKGIEDALAGIGSNVSGVYRFDPLFQKFDLWFPGRPDLSNITTVKPYDQLFILMSAGATWEQEQSTAQQPSVSLAQGWNSICYTGEQKAIADATAGIAGGFDILYMLTGTQSWATYVPGRADLSDITQLKPYDSVLVLITEAGGITWAFGP